MRILFTTWSWNTHYYPMVPLAWSARAAGHEVMVATQPGLADTVRRSGLPVAGVGTDTDIESMMGAYMQRADEHGATRPEWSWMRQFGVRNCWLNVAVCHGMADGLWEFASRWKPDLVVFEATTYAGPLVAARLGVPAIRHSWGIDYAYLQREFDAEAIRPFAERWNLPDVEPLGLATVDPCPPVLQLPDTPTVPVPIHRLPTRYIPYNGHNTTPTWLTQPPTRPRICLTWGLSARRFDPNKVMLKEVAQSLAHLDADIIAAISPTDRDTLGTLPPNLTTTHGTPLHALLPSCDLLISQGGLGTVMTAVATGTPQLLIPQTTDCLINAQQLKATHTADYLLPEAADPTTIAEHTTRLLQPHHRHHATLLQHHNDQLPTPTTTLTHLHTLTQERR
jgi:UDP:flavonoid glycosyltransferase YjiC (YdhE family)